MRTFHQVPSAPETRRLVSGVSAFQDGGSLASTATKRAAASKPGQYESADIQVLEGVEHVRLRPGMYIGTTSSRGLHHLVYEVVDNSIDEAMAGHASRTVVIDLAGPVLAEPDDGRGIPV